MARFAQILVVTKEINIPDGVGLIIAEYAEMTDEERTIYMLYRGDGDMCVHEQYDSKRILSLRFHSYWNNTISVWNGNAESHPQNYSTFTMSRKLRGRFWTGNANARRAHRDASLWQQIYNLWISL